MPYRSRRAEIRIRLKSPANTGAPLTGNEPPQELFRRVQEMRERGEEVSPEIRAKLRELFQSGVLQRPGGGGGGFGARGGGGSGSRSSQPASRTLYLLATNAPSGEPAPQAFALRPASATVLTRKSPMA